MIQEIRKRIQEHPFVPFVIRSTSGHDYPVPTLDHVWLPKIGSSRVVVVDDEGAVSILWPLHIAAVLTRDAETAGASGE